MTVRTKSSDGEMQLKRASFAQERFWFIEALDPQSALYNQLICFRIFGDLDPGILQQSIAEVIRRHTALRTNLFLVEGQVYQSSSSILPELVVVELADTSYNNPLDEAGRILKELARRPYDLASEPLIRPRLIRLGKDDMLLAFVTHHTIMDGWSMGVMMKELATIYEALDQGLNPEAVLREPGLQYDEYSIRQREAFDSGEYSGQLQYWLDRLNGSLPILELPFDHFRPAVQTYDGKAFTIVLPPALKVALQKVGRQEKATLFMTLLSAFFALLNRFTGQEDIVIGCPIAGRNQFDVEGMIGLCVNTLAIRGVVSPDQSFRELLRQVRVRTLEAYENQDLPFEKLVEKLSVQRSLNIPPVFQTLFQLRNFPTPATTIGGCQIERYELEEVLVKTDLTLEITDTPEGLSCRFEYPVSLFDLDSIVRMAGHWQTLLSDIADDPGKKVSTLRILTDFETQEMVEMGKGRKTSYPRENIARLFEARVKECPEAIAIRQFDETMTYRQLDERSNSLAHHLREMNVMRGDIVVLFMERSVHMIVAMLATLKAGGAYLPISPVEPESRIGRMLESVIPRAAITDPGQSFRIDRYVPAISFVDDGAAIAEKPCCPEGDPGPEDLVYVMFTSGSTGKPKGVCIPHRGIARLVLNTDYVKIGPDDIVGHLSDPAFDASTFETWGALLNGATLAIIDKDVALSPPSLKAYIKDNHISVMFMTTPLFHTIVSEDPSAFCDLRHLLVGGDVMDPVHAMSFLERCNNTTLGNGYGPTENTTFSTCYNVKMEDCGLESISIGRPIANSDILILDNMMQTVPVGVTGEIYVSGDGLARGYLDSPALTASKFLPDPYVPDRLIYKTGDLGRFLADGNVQFIGRADSQVKIRGFRVEIGEVISAIETHPSVRQAIVTTYQGPGGMKSLACYLVKNEENQEVPVEELRHYVTARLPSHMVPSNFIWIDTIPLTSRGKIDISSLPLPLKEATKPEHEIVCDDCTSALASVWKIVMGIEEIGLDDDFFSVGGHSLLAIRLIASIEEKFKTRLPISAIFTSPTIRSMAALLRDKDEERYSHILIPLKTGGDRSPVYCIHGVPGTLFEFSQLAQIMGDDQPVYGIQSPGIDDREKPLESVEEMACRYIQLLRKKQPHGPYHLLAYCAGAPIAYEIACRLESDGEKNGILAILDYSAPNQNTKSHFWSCYMFIWDNIGGALSHIQGFFQAHNENRMRCITKLPRFIIRKVHRFPGEISGTFKARSSVITTPVVAPFVVTASTSTTSIGEMPMVGDYPEWILDLHEPQRTIAMKNFNATSAYKPGRYHGKIILFMSTIMVRNCKRQGTYDHSFGWKMITTGRIDTHVIKGDHLSILQGKGMEQIALAIRREIDLLSSRRKGHDRQ